jgi:hypothetical protein
MNLFYLELWMVRAVGVRDLASDVVLVEENPFCKAKL